MPVVAFNVPVPRTKFSVRSKNDAYIHILFQYIRHAFCRAIVSFHLERLFFFSVLDKIVAF